MKGIFLIFLLLVSLVNAQDDLEVDTLRVLEEEFFENFETDEQIDEILEQLEFIRINLNKAEVDDLTEIPFITSEMASKIIEYRNRIGGFKTKEQVFEIPGVDERVKSFLYRNGYIQKPRLNFQLRTRLLSKNSIKRFWHNFSESFKTYQLGRFTISNFSGGYVIEKDYGEKRINDLVNFFAEYRGTNVLRKLIVGNYVLQFGQGILLWRPVSLGKGSDAISPAVRSFENYSSSYISTDEVKPMFGGVLTSRLKKLEITLFYSKTDLPSLLDSAGRVRYIDFSGINTRERDFLARNLVGGIISFGKEKFSIGVLNYYEKLSCDFSPSISRPFKKESFYSGFEFDVYYRNLNLFGEIATRRFHHFSYVVGLTIGFGDLSFVFHFRKLNPNFVSINGNAFSERYGEAWNEEGFYSGVKFKIWRLRFSGYWDIFKFPRVKQDDVKSGMERRVEVSLAISKNFNLKLMFRNKIILRGLESIDELGRTYLNETFEKRENTRLEFENKFSKVSFRSRVEVVQRRLNGFERGFLIYQSIRYEFSGNFRVYGRILFFNSDSYWSRIYAYEDDIDGVVSLLPFYGEGIRWYLVVKYNLKKIIALQVKYGESLFIDKNLVRSGFGVQIEIRI